MGPQAQGDGGLEPFRANAPDAVAGLDATANAAPESGVRGLLDVDLLMATVRNDASDTDSFFRVLVVKLADALGERVRIERGGGMLRRDRPVVGIEVDLTEGGTGVVLTARRDRTGIACTGKRPGGVSPLSKKPVGMAEWIDALVAALADAASRSEQTWNALHGLLS